MVTQRRLKKVYASSSLLLSLCPPVNVGLCAGNCFRSELPSTRLGCEYERFRHTGWSTKESWDVSGDYLFIYLFIYLFLLECLWSAKMTRIEGQLAFTKPHLFGQFIFHQEPVLDQTMTNLCTTEYNRHKIP